jgi:two-component system, NarL family, sensor histidine kinase UhpB
MSLFRRVFLINAALVTTAAILLLVTPATVSAHVRVGEGAVLVGGVAVVLAASFVLMRRAFADLDRLAGVMRQVDLQRPGQRVELNGARGEVGELADTFNAMLDRLERERLESSTRVISAQERERRRIALELHDEVGQTLTGLMLELNGVLAAAEEPLRSRLVDAQENARAGVEAVRDVARGLRPDALEDFGLRTALLTLGSSFAERAQLRFRRRLPPEIPPMAQASELVAYRVAQEALTNVARHAEATEALLAVEVGEDRFALEIVDDGRGIDRAAVGSGLAGMRERALLAGGTVEIGPVEPHGTRVRLELPR